MVSVSLRRAFAVAPALLLFPASLSAQVLPTRLYTGLDRPIPVAVRVPDGAAGEPRIDLLTPVVAQVRASAKVAPGEVDLAKAFPDLWRTLAPPPKEAEKPEGPAVLYAQLVVGDTPVGPALVLQPLVDPAYAVLIDETGQPRFRPSKGVVSGVRTYADRRVILDTSLGSMTFRLRPDQAPNTAWNFLHLVEGGFYEGVVFHRVRPRSPSGAGFVVQAGDPTQGTARPASGEGGPGYMINLEPSRLPHDFGVLSMSRRQNLPNSAGSQFFVALSREGTAFLDGVYTSFGQLVEGEETLRAIAAVEVGEADRPKDPPVIRRARAVDAPPYAAIAPSRAEPEGVPTPRPGVPRARPVPPGE